MELISTLLFSGGVIVIAMMWAKLRIYKKTGIYWKTQYSKQALLNIAKDTVNPNYNVNGEK